MAVRYYDEALVEKIKSWIPDNTIQNKNKLTILKPDEATRFFEKTLDDIQDKTLKLPLIAISRDKNIDILNMNKHSKTFDGFQVIKYENTETKNKVIMSLNVIPIQIGYQIDIYTRSMKEADEYIRNFVFNFINYPRLVIDIPYNEITQAEADIKINHVSNIHLDSVISDNSDIKEHLFPDQFVRFTLKLIIDDAYLFSAPIKEPIALEVTGVDLYNSHNELIVKEDLDSLASDNFV